MTHSSPTDCANDSELIRMVAAGDRQAFDQLYRRHAPAVLRMAARRLGSRNRAEDATQETFTAIWRSARTYKADRGPGAPWLYAVARNAIVNQARFRTEAGIEVPDTDSGEVSPAEHAESSFVSARVHDALRFLPERERTLIELAYWSDLPQSEIASQLGIPLGTVKTRTRSALARLADLLDREELA